MNKTNLEKIISDSKLKHEKGEINRLIDVLIPSRTLEENLEKIIKKDIDINSSHIYVILKLNEYVRGNIINRIQHVENLLNTWIERESINKAFLLQKIEILLTTPEYYSNFYSNRKIKKLKTFFLEKNNKFNGMSLKEIFIFSTLGQKIEILKSFNSKFVTKTFKAKNRNNSKYTFEQLKIQLKYAVAIRNYVYHNEFMFDINGWQRTINKLFPNFSDDEIYSKIEKAFNEIDKILDIVGKGKTLASISKQIKLFFLEDLISTEDHRIHYKKIIKEINISFLLKSENLLKNK